MGRRRRSRWPLGSIIKGGTKDLEHLHFPYSWPASLTRVLQRLSQDEESGNRGRAGQDRRLMVIKVLMVMRIQFRAGYGVLPFAGNFGKDRQFSHTEWLCLCGEEREEEAEVHGGTCKVYGDLRSTPWVPDSQIKHSMVIVPVCSFRVRSGTPATLVQP